VSTPGPVARAAELASLGRAARPTSTDTAHARVAMGDDDPRVRAAALGVLVRSGTVDAGDDWRAALRDPSPAVRRRAAELAPALEPALDGRDATVAPLIAALDDPDVTVVEAAAWALGELDGGAANAVDALVHVATGHRDALAREAAVAALGAIGDERGLPAILAATDDKPAVRRRAVLALAPFDGAEVDAALARAHTDRDWQVRQAAEDLTGEPG
jgi:HEAT repeat protein